jgi:hypothetical protein
VFRKLTAPMLALGATFAGTPAAPTHAFLLIPN